MKMVTGNSMVDIFFDHSAASTSGLYNERLMDWDEEILAYAGLRKDQLPEAVSTRILALPSPQI